MVKLGENETVISYYPKLPRIHYCKFNFNTFNNFLFHNLSVGERRLSILSTYKQISKNSIEDR